MKTDIKEIKLQIWEEIIGNCVKFEDQKDQVVLMLRTCRNMQIAYQRNSKEGIILRRFGRKLVGRKLGFFELTSQRNQLSQESYRRGN